MDADPREPLGPPHPGSRAEQQDEPGCQQHVHFRSRQRQQHPSKRDNTSGARILPPEWVFQAWCGYHRNAASAIRAAAAELVEPQGQRPERGAYRSEEDVVLAVSTVCAALLRATLPTTSLFVLYCQASTRRRRRHHLSSPFQTSRHLTPRCYQEPKPLHLPFPRKRLLTPSSGNVRLTQLVSSTLSRKHSSFRSLPDLVRIPCEYGSISKLAGSCFLYTYPPVSGRRRLNQRSSTLPSMEAPARSAPAPRPPSFSARALKRHVIPRQT